MCKEKCAHPDHERLLYCYNCKISGDCSRIKEHNQHYIVYNCDTCASEDTLHEICEKLKDIDVDKVLELYYTFNKFFTLYHCYWGFGQS